MTSHLFSFTGNTSVLSSTFYPEITLEGNYSCGLLDLATYNSTPNVSSRNNKIYHRLKGGSEYSIIEVPVGSYEAEDLLEDIKRLLQNVDVTFVYTIDKRTLKTRVVCYSELQVTPHDSVFKIFGYRSDIPAHAGVVSEDIIKISKLNVIRVECNIVSGAFVNGKQSHTIYEFASNKVDVGYKIIEQPSNIIYMPVVPKQINFIEISLVDQDGELVDFRGEEVTCRIHLKRDDK